MPGGHGPCCRVFSEVPLTLQWQVLGEVAAKLEVYRGGAPAGMLGVFSSV